MQAPLGRKQPRASQRPGVGQIGLGERWDGVQEPGAGGRERSACGLPWWMWRMLEVTRTDVQLDW